MLSVFILTTFLLTIRVNASSEQTYFPIIQNANNSIPNNVLTWFQQNQYQSGCHFVIYGPYSSGTISGSLYYEYYFVRWNSSYDSSIRFVVQNDGHSVYVQKNGSVSGFNNGLIRYQTSNNQIYVSISNGGNTIYSPLVLQSSSYNSNVSWVSNFDVLDTSGNVLLFLVPPVTVPDTGHAEDPMDNIPSFVPPIGMHPSQAPTVPSYTFPSLSTKPTWDTDHPFDSLFNLIDWGFDFSYDLLTGILQNIIDWATFFGNLIVWIYEQIWNYITFFIGWLYRIFEYLFSPIYNFLKALFHDGDDVISLADLLYNLYVRFDSFASSIFQDSWFTNFWTNFSNVITNSLLGFHNLILFYDKLVQLGTVNNEFSILNLVKALFVPDPDTVNLHLMGHDDFNFYSTGHAISNKASYFVTTFSSITPVKQFYVPSTTYHGVNIGGFYIDFSWYDDYKFYGDIVISTFLTIGFVYWCILNMSNFIRGFSSVGSDVSKMEK